MLKKLFTLVLVIFIGQAMAAEKFKAGKDYKIISKLYEDIIGSVFTAEKAGDGGVVRIKLLKEELSKNDELVDAFAKSGEVCCSVTGKYAIKAEEYGQDNGFHYIALEYVDGGDLRDRIDRGLSLKQALGDPWQGVAQKYPEGSAWLGEVVELVASGICASCAAKG